MSDQFTYLFTPLHIGSIEVKNRIVFLPHATGFVTADGLPAERQLHYLETRAWGRAIYAERAGQRAYEMAGIRNPMEEIDFAEVADGYSYKELQHLEGLGFCLFGEAGHLTAEGVTDRGGYLPVNVSGGSLGGGDLLDASGLRAVVEVVLQLRGEAGARQLPEVETGLAFGWRGVPTTSGAAVVLNN